MVNLERAKRLLRGNLFPWNSKVTLTFADKVILDAVVPEQVITEQVIEQIVSICSGGPVKNTIEEILDFSDRDVFIDHFYRGCNVTVEKLDIKSSVAHLEINLEIFYANCSRLTDNQIKKIKKVEFRTFFGRFSVE